MLSRRITALTYFQAYAPTQRKNYRAGPGRSDAAARRRGSATAPIHVGRRTRRHTGAYKYTKRRAPATAHAKRRENRMTATDIIIPKN